MEPDFFLSEKTEQRVAQRHHQGWPKAKGGVAQRQPKGWPKAKGGPNQRVAQSIKVGRRQRGPKPKGGPKHQGWPKAKGGPNQRVAQSIKVGRRQPQRLVWPKAAQRPNI